MKTEDLLSSATCTATARGRRELYLYSDSDPLCDSGKVAELVRERRAGVRGCDATEVRWVESRHCTHLIDKRDEYIEALTGFLRVGEAPPSTG